MFVQSTNQWRNQRFKLEEKLSWKIPTDLCKRPTSQHSEKKNLRNEGESRCGWLYNTKTPNQRKMLRKTQKEDTVLKITKYELRGGAVFAFSWPGSQVAPLPSVNYSTATNTLKYWLNKNNNQYLKSLLRLININVSNRLSGKRHLSGLNTSSATLKIRLLVISKMLTVSSNCGLRSSTSQQSVVQLSFWNKMNSNANIAGHLSIGPIVNS